MSGLAVTIARAVLAIGLAYILLGAAVALPFAARGVGRIDPAARQGSIAFRLLIIPASICLWPIVLRRWRAARARP